MLGPVQKRYPKKPMRIQSKKKSANCLMRGKTHVTKVQLVFTLVLDIVDVISTINKVTDYRKLCSMF